MLGPAAEAFWPGVFERRDNYDLTSNAGPGLEIVVVQHSRVDNGAPQKSNDQLN